MSLITNGKSLLKVKGQAMHDAACFLTLRDKLIKRHMQATNPRPESEHTSRVEFYPKPAFSFIINLLAKKPGHLGFSHF